MKNFLAFLIMAVILCSNCKRILHDDCYVKSDHFDTNLQQHKPDYDILCPSCYRLIPFMFKDYYEMIEKDLYEKEHLWIK